MVPLSVKVEKSYLCIVPRRAPCTQWALNDASCFVGLVVIVTLVLRPGHYYLGQKVNVNLKCKAILICV